MNDQLEVKYYKPLGSNIVSGILMMLLFAVIIFAIHYLPETQIFFELLSSIIFLYSGLMFLVVMFAKKYEDRKGKFTFQTDGVLFEHGNKKDFLLYSRIKAIRREWYNQQVNVFIVSATQSNANEYRICMSEKTYILRVAHCEEKAYRKAAQKLNQQIYKDKNLTPKQGDAMFDREKPDLNYSVVKVIELLSQKTGLGIIDNTDNDPNPRKQRRKAH